jgi:hypothetical protein
LGKLRCYEIANKHPNYCYIIAESDEEAIRIAYYDGFIRKMDGFLAHDCTEHVVNKKDRFGRLIALAIEKGLKGKVIHESPRVMWVGGDGINSRVMTT